MLSASRSLKCAASSGRQAHLLHQRIVKLIQHHALLFANHFLHLGVVHHLRQDLAEGILVTGRGVTDGSGARRCAGNAVAAGVPTAARCCARSLAANWLD